MKAAELFVQCLQNEGVEFVFGLPGEEGLDLLDAMDSAGLRFIPTRHEQSAAFMADVYGRLTGRPGVCLATLGPGATNLLTGIADAFLDRAPVVAITGQAGLDRIHKESHQYIQVLEMFRPVTKWNARVERPEIIPELVRKAFKVAQTEKPGPTHIELPEDMAREETSEEPLVVRPVERAGPSDESIRRAAAIIAEARRPLILAGNGVVRGRASGALTHLAQQVNIPVTSTFMAKGCIDDRLPLSLLSIGLQARDWIMTGLDQADVVLAIGYDLVEYSPAKWNSGPPKRIIHVDSMPAEVDAHYLPEVEVVGEIRQSLEALAKAVTFCRVSEGRQSLRETILGELEQYVNDETFPMKPQKVLADLRRVLRPEDIVISDVGAHKLWVARMYQAYQPNTVIVSNGFAAMGIAIPGAIAAKLVYPERNVVAIVGDGAFMINSQELETAVRLKTPFVTMIWVDGGYGLVEWNQQRRFGRSFGVHFSNPDFVRYAQSFGIPAYRVTNANRLPDILREALAQDLPSIVAIPIDYRENLKLTARLGQITAGV